MRPVSSISCVVVGVVWCGVVALALMGASEVVYATSSPRLGKSILVAYESEEIRSSHTKLFALLKRHGFSVTFVDMSDEYALMEYDEPLYHHFFLFASSEYEIGVDSDTISKYMDKGGNVVVMTGPKASEPLRRVLDTIAGLKLSPERHVAVDHSRAHVSLGTSDHSTFVSTSLVKSAVMVGENPLPIVYRGAALSVRREGSQVIPVLRGSEFTMTRPLGSDSLIGSRLILLGAMQARNAARLLVVPSMDVFSDAFLDASAISSDTSLPRHSKCGNEELMENLLLWATQQRGILKASRVHHQLKGQSRAPQDGYRVMDDVEFSMEIQEYSLGKWVPYAADDVQVEFVMLHPYVRKTLSHDKKGHFSTAFRAPDTYGAFKFRVEYSRLGYSSIELSTPVPVRPFRHDEYERFIPSAYPYYASAFSVMIGFLLFSVVFLLAPSRLAEKPKKE